LNKCSTWKYDNTSPYSGISKSDQFLTTQKNPEFDIVNPPKHKVDDFVWHVSQGYIWSFITNFFIYNLIILGLFEMGRRVFYYIYFGKLKPNKQ
jgi:hypothetical protein